jgi:hypothetical protein
MDLRQMRLTLHHARTLALSVQLAAGQHWGAAHPVSIEAGRSVVQLDAALATVDKEACE